MPLKIGFFQLHICDNTLIVFLFRPSLCAHGHICTYIYTRVLGHEKFECSFQGFLYFSLNPMDLIIRRKSVDSTERSSYFCSELVAAAYKAMGILPAQLPSNGFLPGIISTYCIFLLLHILYNIV